MRTSLSQGTVDPSWGDWKPHVAMMIANKNTDEDLTNVMTISQNLGTQFLIHYVIHSYHYNHLLLTCEASRDLCGSHLCCLLAGGKVSHPGESKCRVSLLGADHTKPLAEYATVECIQRSEVPLY